MDGLILGVAPKLATFTSHSKKKNVNRARGRSKNNLSPPQQSLQPLLKRCGGDKTNLLKSFKDGIFQGLSLKKSLNNLKNRNVIAPSAVSNMCVFDCIPPNIS